MKDACFGWTLDPQYKEYISEFLSSYKMLQDFTRDLPTEPRVKLTVSWKVHACCHLAQFLEDKSEGLARYSEQAGESSHYAFKIH